MEARVARQALHPEARPFSLHARLLPLAGRNAVHPLAGSGTEAVMTSLQHVLLINPTITSRRSARFPLAVLNLSAALDGRYTSSIIDGNIDRDVVTTTLQTLAGGRVDAVGLSVMGGPQLRSAIL